MKTSAVCLLVAAALGAGMGVGWFLRGGGTETKETERGKGRIARITEPGAAGGRRRVAGAEQRAMEETGALVAAELERVKRMSVQEFGEEMAKVWLSGNEGPEKHLKRALFLSLCDAERGMAFWKAHSRQLGLRLNENAKIPDFFQAVGHRDGKRFMEMVKEAMPGGPFNGIASGWAAAAPEEAVAWLNEQPDNLPGYDSILQGMMWGLAEKSPATALYAYERLRPEDQNFHTAVNVGLSTVRNHGMQGMNELAGQVKDEKQRELLLTAYLGFSNNEPPSDFVKWMAGPLETAPYLRGKFNEMAGKWVAKEPEAALAWVQENAARAGAKSETALTVVAASLAGKGKGGELAAWLEAHPNLPGQEAIVSGKMKAAGQ